MGHGLIMTMVGQFLTHPSSKQLWIPLTQSRLEILMRVQGISPFLFTFRLVAFNYASYPALLMHYGPAWTCSSGVARSSHHRETSSSRIHRTPGAVRFCCRADPLGSPTCVGPLASWRGDFPQCRTLSATLLLPQASREVNANEPNGPLLIFHYGK